jgi:arylsulfatase A-like enzyme
MPRRPNVVLIITDDQGYGDLGCTGNPWLRTPHIDALHDSGVRFSDFHASPLCTPTRGALLTARRPTRNGAWATCWGRSILRRDELTMADVFRHNGYRTSMFGKWHLGDNYPYRPQDRGFEHVVAHKGGGVGQTPDWWGNNYFDDAYFHNGRPQQHAGYCTDIWFDEAMAYMGAHCDEPFFVYLATNAPHSPYLVEERYKAPYQDNPDIPEPAFYGMIANIDENVGRLRAWLEANGLADDTLLLFMTDNGSSGGWFDDGRGYNAGLRGKKGSYYDGGHRVPLFAYWPGGEIVGGADVHDLVLHLDLLPTLVNLLALDLPREVEWDGRSAAPLLRGETANLPDRVHFEQIRQSTEPPEKWVCAVMTRQWRLIHGRELYDIVADPGQQHDLAVQQPAIVAWLRDEYEHWWAEIRPDLDRYCPIVLGNPAENPTRLDAMDVMGDVAWHQGHILMAQRSTGRWAVEIERSGVYRFALRRWPTELGLPIGGQLSHEHAKAIPYEHSVDTVLVQPVVARLGLFGREWRQPVDPGQVEAVFTVTLEAGETALDAWFIDADGKECGAYYVYVERLEQPHAARGA